MVPSDFDSSRHHVSGGSAEPIFGLADERQISCASGRCAGLNRKLNSGPQNWKQYTASLLIFNTVLFIFGFVVLALQPLMPMNSLGRGMLEPSNIFHTVVSFMTNTDVQHYSGDQHFSNFTQLFFCFSQFFLSASIGFCSLTVIIRLFRGDVNVGNFFVDMWRVVAYMFLPISLLLGVVCLQQGSPDDVRLCPPGGHA